MTPKNHLKPEIRPAVEFMEQVPHWGKFLFTAIPLGDTRYYAFTNRYVTEAYLLAQYQMRRDDDLEPASA